MTRIATWIAAKAINVNNLPPINQLPDVSLTEALLSSPYARVGRPEVSYDCFHMSVSLSWSEDSAMLFQLSLKLPAANSNINWSQLIPIFHEVLTLISSRWVTHKANAEEIIGANWSRSAEAMHRATSNRFKVRVYQVVSPPRADTTRVATTGSLMHPKINSRSRTRAKGSTKAEIQTHQKASRQRRKQKAEEAQAAQAAETMVGHRQLPSRTTRKMPMLIQAPMPMLPSMMQPSQQKKM